jgi:hypothetical protein
MSTYSTANLVLATAVSNMKNHNFEIPSAEENPYLQSSSFKQGTLYIIIFPTLIGLILLYVISVGINTYRANVLAKSIEPFDKEYEFAEITTNINININDVNNTIDDLDDSFTLNPFSDNYETSNKSFHHKKNTSSVDFISQYRRSMDYLTGMESSSINNLNSNKNKIHSKNKSIGSVLTLNFVDQPQLKPSSHELSSDSQIFYSTNTNDSQNNLNNSALTFINLNNEPLKSLQNNKVSEITSIKNDSNNLNNSNINKFHSHSRTLSSHILDDFISTGELPILNQIPQPSSPSHQQTKRSRSSSPIRSQSNSMFENNVNAYDIPDSNLNRSPSPIRYSPIRGRIHQQNESKIPSKSPSKSSYKSPTRGSTRDSSIF